MPQFIMNMHVAEVSASSGFAAMSKTSNTYLEYYIENNCIDDLRCAVEVDESVDVRHAVVNKVIAPYGTLLHYATKLERIDAVRVLLSEGADPSVLNEEGFSAFDIAQSKEVKCVYFQYFFEMIAQSKYLCEYGFSVNAQNASGDTALHLALSRDEPEIVQCLLDFKADLSIKNNAGLDCRRSNSTVSEQRDLFSSFNSLDDDDVDNADQLPSSEHEFAASSPEVKGQIVVENGMAVVNGRGSCDWAVDESGDVVPDEPHDEQSRRIQSAAWKLLSNVWPEPQLTRVRLDESDGCSCCCLPEDSTNHGSQQLQLNVYFYSSSEVGHGPLVDQWQQLVPLFESCGFQVHFQQAVFNGQFPFEASALVCGVYAGRFRRCESYRLKVGGRRPIELISSDLAGFNAGLRTLAQLFVRTARVEIPSPWSLPRLCVDDFPSRPVRAVLFDLAGCRVPTVQTLHDTASRLVSWLKLNVLMVHFEWRVQDSNLTLPYTSAELFRLQTACGQTFADFHLVPSLEVNCEEIGHHRCTVMLSQFSSLFSTSDSVHVGSNLCRWMLSKGLSNWQWFFEKFRRIFWSVGELADLEKVHQLPLHCVLMLDKPLMDTDQKRAAVGLLDHSICLCLSAGEPGFVADSIGSMTTDGELVCSVFNTAQNCVGLVVCDWSGCAIGCSAVAPALRYLPTAYFLGLAWNCRQRRTPDQLTDITAHAFLGSTELAPLFHAALAVGKVERALSPLSSRAAPVSAIVQILLNADSLDLDNKARIELQASLDGLENLKRHCDFNNDQTLALLEMEVVLDLTILACRIGQSLCMLGTNPSPAYGCQMINVGISNLSPTARTDLANRLLEIKSRFQHVWLGRNLDTTLPEVMKMFNNLLHSLLPSSMQRCDGVNRYNPDNVEFLEKYVREQCDKQGVDMEANLTLLKLYQLNPNSYNERIVCRIFLKCVMALPSADMVLAKCLLDEYRMESECLKTICDISALLETCRFKEAWQLIRKEADLVDLAIGFEEHVRQFVAHVVSITYQNIDTQLLQQLLGDVNDSDFENLCKQYNWTRKDDGSTFISNHEATIKSRNIEEKIEFNDMMSFIRDLSSEK
ncbi:Eukaryotic translation initiation factor 3 subunit K [Trichinella nelsoni]|uniref:Eukaryotic translation initiation factor 3 subunit K n=1 Tax=Trichinella nelsoni TaxID=6336 RepID=A0A0V0S5B3_9BILA|nr:Eukaryotic translation initiation factor 3 subunit K [Trichinella nelsoni]